DEVGAGAAVAGRLERPRPPEALQVAAGLGPAQPARGLVGEAQLRRDLADLGLVDDPRARDAALAVAVEHLDALDTALPLAPVVDVGRDPVAARPATVA